MVTNENYCKYCLPLAERLSIIDGHIKNGAIIPCPDGVIISPEAEIGAGTVVLPNTILIGLVIVGKGCVIGPNSLIENSVLGDFAIFNQSQCYDSEIGDNVTAGPFAHIRPNTKIADDARIGNFVEVKNSNIGKGTKISHLTYVGDSDVGEKVNFGCGTVTVNYDGKEKYRTTIENSAFIGCNTNIIAPLAIGEHAYIAAGSTLTEDVEPYALAIARARQINKENWVKIKEN